MYTCERIILNAAIISIVIMTNLNNIVKALPVDAETLAIDKCREQCFFEIMENSESFKNDFKSEESFQSCKNISNCSMCHDYCYVIAKAVVDLRESMCGDPIFCMKGCQVACNFHHVKLFDILAYQTG